MARCLGVPLLLLCLAAGSPARAEAPPDGAVKGILAAFREHPIVIVGEAHGILQAGDFYAALVRDPSFQALAPDIVVEFASRQSQGSLDRYVGGDDVPIDEIRRIWRDTTKVAAWESPIYAGWLAAVRGVNVKLPAERRLRVLAGDTAIDWGRIRTHEQWAALGDNDVSFAGVIVREVLDRKRRALVVLGGNHVTRSGDRHGGENTTTRVEAKYPGATFVALLYGVATPWDAVSLPDGAPPSLLPAPPTLRANADAVLFLGNREDLDLAPPPAGSIEGAYLAEIDRRSMIEWGELRMREETRAAAFPDLPWREDARSPRLARLEREARGGGADAANRFWAEVRSPLVEPAAEKGWSLVTFLHRGGPAALAAQLTTTRETPRLQRLLDTDVWCRTYDLRDDMRLTYTLGEDPARVLELPGAPAQPWNAPRPGVPAGKVVETEAGGRGAWIYTPPGYEAKSAAPYPILVCFDGGVYSSSDLVPTPAILDNLIFERRIPPMIGVFVAQSAQPQRNLELSNNPGFVDSVADLLLPHVRRAWRATADPARTVVCGSSAGGLAAVFAAFRRPEVFGNVLSQSGAFWPGETRDDPEHEWILRRYQRARKLPIRFVLQAGAVEVVPTPLDGPPILVSNRRLRDVLTAKGYELHYHEIDGGHEPLSWRGGLAEGLIELAASWR